MDFFTLLCKIRKCDIVHLIWWLLNWIYINFLLKLLILIIKTINFRHYDVSVELQDIFVGCKDQFLVLQDILWRLCIRWKFYQVILAYNYVTCVLELLVVIIHDVCHWDDIMAWRIHAKFYDDLFRNSNVIKVIASTVWDAVMLVLRKLEIYDVRRWNGLRLHDIYTKFQDDGLRHLSNITLVM
jgi:hypothetical protein